jgi:hypothetical protein
MSMPIGAVEARENSARQYINGGKGKNACGELLEHIHKSISWLEKSPLLPHSQTFRFFAHGAFVLEPWTNAIKGKKLSAPNLILLACS